MYNPIQPADTARRLEALHAYEILDTLTEKDYDDITLLAATICKTPVSLITFIDKDRQWFKSHYGVDVPETILEYSFCMHALNTPELPLVVEDSRKDERFADNPLVTGDPYVVFYTGMPLVSPDGCALGTLCVIDHHPKKLSEEQLKALKTLSHQVVNLLEMRKFNIALQITKKELELRNKELEKFSAVVSSDIKAPLSGIIMANQILDEQYSEALGDEGLEVVNVSRRYTEKIKGLVDGMLSYYKGGDQTANAEEFYITQFFDSLFSDLPSDRKYKLDYPHGEEKINMIRSELEQIFGNLVQNSIQYNESEIAEIKISFSEAPQQYFFSISDNGIGIAKEDQEKIFNLFTTVPSQSGNDVEHHGIGLSTVKKIVEKNGGIVTIDSTPGKGTKISFNIKKGWPLGK